MPPPTLVGRFGEIRLCASKESDILALLDIREARRNDPSCIINSYVASENFDCDPKLLL